MDTFTTLSIITWASYEDQMDNMDLDDARILKINQMVEAGKTNGEAVIVSPTVTRRFWVSVAAAQEYIDFMLAEATLQGVTIVSTEIQENAI
jgi:hypothetical protein